MLLLWLLGCAAHLRPPGPLGGLGGAPPPPVAVAEAPARPAKGGDPAATTVATACSFLGERRIEVRGETFRFDCSGLVEASLAGAGLRFRGSSAMLFEAAREHGVLHRRRLPQPGDVAFFDDTYDRNGNGRLDDPLSHTAVVEAVAPDGTVTLIHVGSAGVVRFKMNLRHAEDRTGPDGAVVNDYLRARRASDPPRTRYLSSELWVGFASFWRLAERGGAMASRSSR